MEQNITALTTAGLMSQDTTILLAAAIGIILWNIIIFAVYGIDKRKAAKGSWRTSETTLILCAFLMGGFGAFIGMKVFRHKTKHLKFRLLLPLAIMVNIAVMVAVIWLKGGFA